MQGDYRVGLGIYAVRAHGRKSDPAGSGDLKVRAGIASDAAVRQDP